MSAATTNTKKHKVRKYVFRGLLAFFGLFLITAVDAFVQTYYINDKPLPEPEKFITANPVNLQQIAGISKFRSCQGHEYSGKGREGLIESNRSMKHYLSPTNELRDQLQKIEIFAPFDGRLVFVMPEAKGSQIIMSPSGRENWGLIIFHVDRLQGIGVGSDLKAGQLIGHANVKDRHDFDIALTYTDSSLIVENIAKLFRGSPILPLPKDDYLESAFDYMTDDVRKQFTEAGFKLDDMIYTREYRDSNRCDFDKAAENRGDWQYLPGHDPYEERDRQDEIPQAPTGTNLTPGSDGSQNPPAQLYPEGTTQ